MFELDRAKYRISNTKFEDSFKVPYPFQKNAIASLDAVKQRNPNGFSTMLVLPTGAGKTFTAVHWIINRYINENVKVLWIAHRSELLRQAAETFFLDTNKETLPDRESFVSCTISSEFGRSVNIKGTDDLIIASRQSVVSGDNINYYVKWAKGYCKKDDRKLLLVFDEAHHAAAQSYKKIIKTFSKYIPNIDILGLTATPERTSKYEQGSLKKIFNTGSGIAYSIDMSTLIKLGVLADYKIIDVKSDIDMTELFSSENLKKISKYDLTSLDEKTLEKISNNSHRNKLIADTYLENKEKYGKTIIFAIDVTNAIALNKILCSKGVKSDYVVSGLIEGIHGSASGERNSSVIAAFKNNKLDVIINVNILTEGTDIPDVQTVFLTRPTQSRILMTQMIGRGFRRTNTGKTFCNIVSFVDNWRGMVSFVSPKALLDGEDKAQQYERDIKEKIIQFIKCSDIEKAAMEIYEDTAAVFVNVQNIYPYGVIPCKYHEFTSEEKEQTVTRDILVYDEARTVYEKVYDDIKAEFNPESENYSDDYISEKSRELFFKYSEKMDGKYVGFSSDVVFAIIKSFLSSGEIPSIIKITDRISLYEIAAEYSDIPDNEFGKKLDEIWQVRTDIHKWYNRYEFDGFMRVYRKRSQTSKDPKYVLDSKEEMDMGTLKKYYPEYYNELREYVFMKNYDKDRDEYFASRPGEAGKEYRSKYRKMFEIDHIIPISKGGKTVKDNLQLLFYKDNKIKGNKM